VKPPAADRWWPTTVARILSNEFYAAVNVYGGREYPGDWEAPLDVDTWRAVKDLLGRQDRVKARGVKTLLGGIATCPCGLPMFGARLNGRDGYRCRGEGGGHVQRGDRAQVDHFVAELVIARLAMPDAVDLIKTDDGPDVEELRSRARALRARIDELAADLADPDIPSAITKDAIRAAKKKLAEVEAELAETATSSPLSAVVGADDVRAAWERLDIDRQREVVRTLVRVRLHPVGRGRAAMVFDPETIKIEWRHEA
jgi:site-specific DNA recombinase